MTITKSTAFIRGGAFEIISCPNVLASNIDIKNSNSPIGGLFFIQNSKSIFINFLTAEKTQSLKGGIYTSQVGIFFLSDVYIQNAYANYSAGAFSFNSGNNYLTNLWLFNISAVVEAGVLALNGRAMLFIYNLSSDSSSARRGGFFYCFSSESIEIKQAFLKSGWSSHEGGSFFIDTLKDLLIEKVIFFNNYCVWNGILYIKSMEIESNFTFLNLEFRNNSATKGSSIYSEAHGFFTIKNLLILNAENLPLYFSWNSPITLEISNISVCNTISRDYLFYFSEINVQMEDIEVLNNDLLGGMFYIENSENCKIQRFKSNENDNNLTIFEIISSNFTLSSVIFTNPGILFNLFTADNSEFFFFNSISEQEMHLLF